jgi:hypothetical protein
MYIALIALGSENDKAIYKTCIDTKCLYFVVGNMSPYITSYLRHETSETSLRYSEAMWIFAVEAMGQGLFMPCGGIMHYKIGPRCTTLIGGTILR